MKKILYIALIIHCMGVNAQILENFYAAATIPDSLLQNAEAVIRLDETDFMDVEGQAVIQKTHLIVTVLKNSPLTESLSTPYLYYDKLRKIRSLEARVFNGKGKLVQTLKKKDITDTKLLDGDGFVDDNRYKILNFPRLEYPYTVEYLVEYEHLSTLHYPVFMPQDYPSVSVQRATFSVKTNKKLRFKEINIDEKNKVNIQGDMHTWNFEGIKAFIPAAYTPRQGVKLPMVWTAPTDFKCDNYVGNMSSWENFGKFMLQLNQNRQTLPAKTVDSLKQLVADCATTECKVERIYKHLQNTTRYFSIQLGIGGWQPFPAAYVEAKKYGDCKALSNYMVAMLAAVGVKGHYVVIRANDPIQFEDFPNAHFNHIIACVPMERDTLWLECTSQRESCGFLGTFTDDRWALLVGDEEGKLVRTPVYDEHVNQLLKTATLYLDSTGNATLQARYVYSGTLSETAAYFAETSSDMRKKHFYKNLKINQLELLSLDYELQKGRIPKVIESFNLKLPNLATVNGKRLFLPLNLLSVWEAVPRPDPHHRDVVQATERSFMHIDSIQLVLPAGMSLESKYPPIKIESPFGIYEMYCQNTDGNILFYRKMILKNKILHASQYDSLVDFFRQISKVDKSKLILVKKG